ncbi:MAG: hypothetical protein ABEH77_04925, partial [Halobacteriaceae archaeon]
LSLVATFALGLALTFAGIALSTRGAPGRALALGGLGAAGVAWWAGVDPLAATPYAVYRDPLSAAAAGSLLAVPALAAAGALAYDPTYRRPARTAPDRFRSLSGRVGPLVAKSLLDVARSGGGLWKVVFSGGVVFVVVAFLLSAAGTVTGRPPATGVSFGALLGLTAFTTYNWLTMADDIGFYRRFPVEVAAVFDAKFRAFLVVGLPAALGYYALALALFGAPLLDALAGVVLLVGLSLYLYGVTVFLTGFSPNEFLFDTLLFGAFTAAVAVPLLVEYRVHNPGDVPVPAAPDGVGVSIDTNDVRLFEAGTGAVSLRSVGPDAVLSPGETREVTFAVTMRNERVDEWFTSHVRADRGPGVEATAVSAQFQVVFEVPGAGETFRLPADSPVTYDCQFRTAILADGQETSTTCGEGANPARDPGDA